MNSSALRKAAIVLKTLEQPAAEAILNKMNAPQAAQVRRLMRGLEAVDPAEQQVVLEEFVRMNGPEAEQSDAGGVEIDSQLLQKLSENPPAPESPVENEQGRGRFGFLRRTPAEAIAEVLAEEHPQMVAVVAAHLPPEQSARVAARLPVELQADVLRRIADLEETDDEILDELEQHLEQLFRAREEADGRRTSRVASLQAILSAADDQSRQRLWEQLNARDPRLAELLKPGGAPEMRSDDSGREDEAAAVSSTGGTAADDAAPNGDEAEPNDDEKTPPLEFGDLAALDDAGLALLLAESDPQSTLLALAGADRRLVLRILQLLPRRERKSFERRMERLAPLRLSDLEEAQRRLAATAADLVAQGKLAFPAATPRLAA